MRTARAGLLALALLGAAVPGRSEPGLTAATSLQIPLGSRASALGEAFAAVPGGVDSLGYNPAGLSGADRPVIQSSYVKGLTDDRLSFTAYAHPLGKVVLAAGFLYYDAGSIHLNLSDGTDRVVKAGQDLAGLGSVAVSLPGGLSAGGTAKVFRMELAETTSATGYAADAGVLWRAPLTGLTLGASLQNMGPDVKFESEGDPLPLTVRAGASYLLDLERWAETPGGTYRLSKFRLSADAFRVRDQETAAGTGLEMIMPFGPVSFGAVRFGYVFNRPPDSFTLGVGFREKRFRLDYALGARREVGNAHQVTIGFSF